MLTLIHENRSGKRLEIVVPTSNEAHRIGNLLAYYGEQFDIVLLDDSSTDETVRIAIEGGATVYRRIGEAVGENHFVHYVNELSASACCFYMFADEFCEREQLAAVFEALRQTPCVVLGKRVDWAYGKRMQSLAGSTPRGLCKGLAVYNRNKLHASLEYIPEPPPRIIEVEVHHLHLWSMKSYFGQAGKYAYYEVEQHRRHSNAAKRFLRRFVVSELLLLPRRLWRERKNGPAFLLWLSLMSAIVSLLGIICWIEQRLLKRPEEQLATYAGFYSNRK